ncbi:MAG: adenylate/guanylate cyclase domain-containing protein [Deltaproteobacteria bacterium]|nr:MAG: adenylate/guanylate cyclase domain-containing protein [Deltaproteobacteria bacterium]
MSWDDLVHDLEELDTGDAEAESRIRARFEQEHAVLVLDMSGFSRITQKRGIVAFLALIQRMRTLCGPHIRGAGGRLVKAEADNLLAVFPDPDAALTAALGMHTACGEDAVDRERDDQVRVCIGIGYGPLIDIHHDIFGDELNLASKLGEDLADPGEILLTPSAAKPVESRLEPFEPESHILELSGLRLSYWRISVD